MLFLITAWRTSQPDGDPVVLYCGKDRVASNNAVNSAPAEFLRVERADVFQSFKVTPHRPPASAVPALLAPPEKPKGEEPQKPGKRIVLVPTLEEVMKAGYPKKAALSIIAREQAKADALKANPDISDAALEKIGNPESDPDLQLPAGDDGGPTL